MQMDIVMEEPTNATIYSKYGKTMARTTMRASARDLMSVLTA